MRNRMLFLAMVGLWLLSASEATVVADGWCGDGICQGQACEPGGGPGACDEYLTCAQDCSPMGPVVCGDGSCSPGYEDAGNCPGDCPCGDGVCSGAEWYDTFSCPQDCQYGSGGGGGNCPDYCTGDIQCTSCPDKPYCTNAVCSGFY